MQNISTIFSVYMTDKSQKATSNSLKNHNFPINSKSRSGEFEEFSTTKIRHDGYPSNRLLNIFLVLLFDISANESPNPPTKNSDFSPVAKVSSQREPIPYICGLRTRIECEPVSEHSTRRDRVTNIGYRLSL